MNRVCERVMGRVCLEKFCVLGNTRTKVYKGRNFSFLLVEREREKKIYISILFLNWFGLYLTLLNKYIGIRQFYIRISATISSCDFAGYEFISNNINKLL